MKRAPALLYLALLVTLSVAKIMFLQHQIGLLNNVPAMVITTAALLVGLYIPIVFLPQGWRRRVGLFINFALSSIVLADLIYFKFYDTIIPVYAIFLIKQVGGVSASVSTSLELGYLLLYTDIAVMLVYFARQKRLQLPNMEIPCRKAAIALMILAAFTLSYAGSVATAYANGKQFAMANFGALYYHAYDILDFIVDEDTDGGSFNEPYPGRQPMLPEKLRYHGIARGKNVIAIQAESLQDFVIGLEINGREVTPNLNRLLKSDSFYFDNYYQMTALGNTSDAEFVTHNSLTASLDRPSYQAYEGKSFYTLPLVLKQQGYSTIASHGNQGMFWNREEMYPQQGFDQFVSEENLQLDEIIGMGLSDSSFFRQMAARLQQMQQPFYSFMVTLTSHNPYLMPDDVAKDFPLKPEQENLLGHYLQAMHYLDACIGEFIAELKTSGLYDSCLIAIYGDHCGVQDEDEDIRQQMSELLGREYGFDQMMNVPLIIHLPGMGVAKRQEMVGGQLDFFPTMLNLLGIQPDSSRILLGQDLLNSQHGFVPLQTYMVKGSFVNDEIIYVMSRDGVFENGRAWNLKTGAPIPLAECREGCERAVREYDFSEWYIHQTDKNR